MDRTLEAFSLGFLGFVTTMVVFVLIFAALVGGAFIGPNAFWLMALVGMFGASPLVAWVGEQGFGKTFRILSIALGTALFVYFCLFGIFMSAPTLPLLKIFAGLALHPLAIGLLFALSFPFARNKRRLSRDRPN